MAETAERSPKCVPRVPFGSVCWASFFWEVLNVSKCYFLGNMLRSVMHVQCIPIMNSGLGALGGHHQPHAFSRSKALMGVLLDIPRARVNELFNPDPDRPLAPPFRAPGFQKAAGWAHHILVFTLVTQKKFP